MEIFITEVISMGEVAEHIAKQVARQIKTQSNLLDEMERYVKELVDNKKWPFTTVTPQEYLSVARPLLDIAYDIYSGRLDGKKVPAATFYDNLTADTKEWLKCIQKLRVETMDSTMQYENLRLHNFYGDEHYETQHPAVRQEQVLDTLKQQGYDLNARVLGFMEPFLREAGITPLFVGEENEKRYFAQIEEQRALRVTKEHTEAKSNCLTELKDIVHFGLPSQSALGKLAETFAGQSDKKAHVEELVKAFLSKEIDVEYIELFVVPNLRLEARRLQTEALWDDYALNMQGEQGVSALWTEYNYYCNAVSNIQNAIDEMRKIEARIDPYNSISISKNENGTHTITAKLETGETRDYEAKADGVVYRGSKQARTHTQKRVMDVGSMSRELYREIYERAKREKLDRKEIITPVENSKRDNERRKVVSERAIGERSLTITKTTKYTGTRSSRIDFKADVVRCKKEVQRLSREGYKEKAETIIGGEVRIGGISSGGAALTPDQIGAKATAEAHLIQGTGKLGPVQLAANIGANVSIGKQVDRQEIMKGFVIAAMKELAKIDGFDFDTSLQAVLDACKDGLKGKGGIDWGSLLASVDGMKIFAAEINNRMHEQKGLDLGVEVKSPAADSVRQDIESVKTQAEVLQGIREQAQQHWPFEGQLSPDELQIDCVPAPTQEKEFVPQWDYNPNPIGNSRQLPPDNPLRSHEEIARV